MAMREMKDSGIPWIGEIPKNWEICPLKYLCSYNNETLPENTNGEYEFDYVDIGSVTYGKGIENYQHLKFSKAPSRARRLVKTGDIILSTVRTYLKATAQIPENVYPIVVSTGYLTLRANKQIIPNFLKYSVQQDAFISEIEAKSSGVSYPAINASEAVRTSVIVPPIEEQQRIADFLDAKCAKIDSVRKNVESEIEALKQYKQSVITEAVTKGLDPDVEMKDSGIPWIGKMPKEWETPQLIFMCTMKAGDNLISNEIQQNGNYPVYGGNGIRGYYYRYNISTKVILVGRQGALAGNIHYIQKRIWATEHAIITKPINNVQIKYLFYLLKAMNLNQYAYLTAAQPGLAVNVILHKNGILPSLNEQRQIANYLDTKCSKIDSIIQKKQELLTNLDSYKKSLIYEYVTGKKEVPAV